MNAKTSLLLVVLSLVALSTAACASTIQPTGKTVTSADSRDDWRSSRSDRGVTMR
jgi:predicted small secreted protein